MTASRRAYAIILLLVIAFILYGSLYPFQFHARDTPGGPVAYLLSTRLDWDHPGDMLSNILLYMPFGFFGVCAFAPRFLPVVLAGAALATSMELSQYYDQGRVTSMGDVYADTIGAGLGALLAALVGVGVRWPFVRELRDDPPAALVLVMWFAYRLYPYVPVTTPHKYIRAIESLVTAPSTSSTTFARFAIAWLCVGAILDALYETRRCLLVFLVVIAAEFVGRIMIIDNVLQLVDVLGACAAFAIWALVLRRMRGRFLIVALAFAGVVVSARLGPFTFTTTAHAFGWTPFASFMHGSIGVAMQAFCEKFFQYGGMIWLIWRLGARLDIATALTASLLLATSWAETYLPGRSAEITDAAMALVIGGAFALLRQAMVSASCRPQPTRPRHGIP